MRNIFAAVALAVWTVGASAGVIVSQDRTAFEANFVGPYTVEDFTASPHFPISTGVLNSSTNVAGITPGMIKAGVTYSTPVGRGNFFNIDAGGGFVGGFLDTVTGDRLLTVTFDSAVSAFGFDTNGLAPNVDVAFTFDDNTSASYHGTTGQMAFFGFAGDGGAKIKSAVIGNLQNGTFSFAIDNFTFGNTGVPGGTVPEPASALLVAAAIGAAMTRRRKI